MKTKRILLLVVLALIGGALCLSSCSADAEDESATGWSEELEYRIKKAYTQTYWGTSEDDFHEEDVCMGYYGTYSGYVAVMNTGLGSAIVTPVSVGGHVFSFGTSNVILLYRDGTFYGMREAFEEGRVTQADIDRLYEVWDNNRMGIQ